MCPKLLFSNVCVARSLQNNLSDDQTSWFIRKKKLYNTIVNQATSYISYFDLDSYLTCILLYELLHADTGTPLYGPSYILFVISFTLNLLKW